jgi:hypothetical protein
MVEKLETGRCCQSRHLTERRLNVFEGTTFIQENPLQFIFIWDSIALTVFGAYKLSQTVKTEPFDVEAHNREAARLAEEEVPESEPMMVREGESVRITSVPDRPSWMN